MGEGCTAATPASRLPERHSPSWGRRCGTGLWRTEREGRNTVIKGKHSWKKPEYQAVPRSLWKWQHLHLRILCSAPFEAVRQLMREAVTLVQLNVVNVGKTNKQIKTNGKKRAASCTNYAMTACRITMKLARKLFLKWGAMNPTNEAASVPSHRRCFCLCACPTEDL